MKALWPKCEAERLKQGYPKIVEIKPGEFDWGEKCTPCEAHERRKEEQKKADEEEHKRFCQIEEKRWKAVLPTQVEVRDLRVDPEWLGNGYWVRGVAKNNSVSEISAIELTVVAHDCPTRGAPQSQCNLIERRRQRTWVDIPRGETSSVEQVFGFEKLPSTRGVLSWAFTVEAVRAPLDASDKLDTSDKSDWFDLVFLHHSCRGN